MAVSAAFHLILSEGTRQFLDLMRKAVTILAACGSVLLAIPVNAQSTPYAIAQWQAKMKTGQQGNYDLASLRDALKTAERFGDSDPRLFETLVRLASFCEDQDCEDQVNGYVDRALRMRAKVKPQDARFASLLMDLGETAADQGRYAEALAVDREALAIREEVLGADAQPTAETYAAMARISQWMKDPTQARRAMQYALEIRERAGKEQSEGFADLLDDSARIYSSAGDEQRAQAEYERAIAIRQRQWGSGDPRFVSALKRTAGENWSGKTVAFSEKLYKRLTDMQKAAHTERSEAYYDSLLDLARFLLFQKRFTEAENAFQHAYQVRESLGKKDAAAADCMEQIARCRMGRGMYKEAVEAGEASIQLRARLEKPAQRNTTSIDALLAEAYLQAHDSKKSDAYFRALNNDLAPTARYTLSQTAEKLSNIYQNRGDYPQAAAKLEVAVAAIEAGNPRDPQLPQKELRLAQLYQRMGRSADANRMNMAVLRSVGQNMQNQGDPKRLKYILIGVVLFFFVLPIFGTGTFALLFAWSARRLDRKLALLYLPSVENVETPELRTSASPERAYVGGFLGLTSVMETDATAVATEIQEPVAEVPQPAAEISEPPVSQVTLRADGSDLFAMRVLNLLFSLLTLGIYSFWGKAKVRRYVCGQAEYQGDWFAFHGTGRELLFGWLRALPALAFIFLFPSLLPLFWQHRAAPYAAQLSAVGAFLLLWPIARVGAYRYRLNRMSWRAIRFSYRGRALRYLAESIAGCLLSAITLGIYVPFFQVRLRKLLLNRTYFGDRVFHFPGRGSDLFPAWLFALPLTVCSLGIGWAWWRALSHRYCWAHTTFAGARFRCTATGGKLLWLWVGNFLVVVPTLGLGMSWAMLRTLRFWTTHVQLVSVPELATVQQDARSATAAGESFADFLGFDFGF
jgi:uncharacterized membrane protein YjgN (DUF898 family)